MNNNFNKPVRFLGYIKNALNLNEIEVLYKYHKVKANRVDLYHDYVQSLCDLIFTTYMGDELTQGEKIQEHFIWCWNYNERIYRELGYKINNEETRMTYFQSFFLDVFYCDKAKDAKIEDSIKNVWDYIFNCEVVKSHKDINNFIEIYYMFDENNWHKKS